MMRGPQTPMTPIQAPAPRRDSVKTWCSIIPQHILFYTHFSLNGLEKHVYISRPESFSQDTNIKSMKHGSRGRCQEWRVDKVGKQRCGKGAVCHNLLKLMEQLFKSYFWSQNFLDCDIWFREEYLDPTMIFTKSRVTLSLLALVIITLSTMMIFVILSVRVSVVSTDLPQPQYVVSKNSK